VDAVLLIARDFTEHMLASEALRQTQSDLAHVNRVSTMGELTASLAHEVNQPIAAAITTPTLACAGLREISRHGRGAGSCIEEPLKMPNRAAEIVSPGPPTVQERDSATGVGACKRSNSRDDSSAAQRTTRYSVSVLSDLATDLPRSWETVCNCSKC